MVLLGFLLISYVYAQRPIYLHPICIPEVKIVAPNCRETFTDKEEQLLNTCKEKLKIFMKEGKVPGYESFMMDNCPMSLVPKNGIACSFECPSRRLVEVISVVNDEKEGPSVLINNQGQLMKSFKVENGRKTNIYSCNDKRKVTQITEDGKIKIYTNDGFLDLVEYRFPNISGRFQVLYNPGTSSIKKFYHYDQDLNQRVFNDCASLAQAFPALLVKNKIINPSSIISPEVQNQPMTQTELQSCLTDPAGASAKIVNREVENLIDNCEEVAEAFTEKEKAMKQKCEGFLPISSAPNTFKILAPNKGECVVKRCIFENEFNRYKKRYGYSVEGNTLIYGKVNGRALIFKREKCAR